MQKKEIVGFVVAMVAPLMAHTKPVQWKLVTTAKVQHQATVAAFANDRVGITVGSDNHLGVVFFTSDGGKTFAKGKTSDQSAGYFGAEILPTGKAWLSANGGDIRTSSDGGKTWTRVGSFGSTIPSQPRLLSFVDAKNGAVATSRKLGLTTDGGENWVEQELPDNAGGVAAIALSLEHEGAVLRLLDDVGRLFIRRTAKGAWSEAPSPLHDPVCAVFGASQAALRFSRDGRGVLVANVDENSGPTPHLYVTRDAGKTWIEETLEDKLAPAAFTISTDGRFLVAYGPDTIRIYSRGEP